MAPPRKWDHDEGVRLFREDGWSIGQVARHFGVSDAAVRIVCDPAYRLRCVEGVKRRDKSATCVDCGKVIWKARSAGSGRMASTGLRCNRCAHAEFTTTVRENSLRCSECGEWKPDEEFPMQRRRVARRGRHSVCRRCQGAARQRARQARRIPCSRCGRLRTHPLDAGARSANTGLCAACWRESPENKVALQKAIAVSAGRRRGDVA